MEKFLNITAVGDICPGDKGILGIGVGNLALKNGTEFFFTEVKNTFKNADVVVGNLEGLLTDDINNVKTKIFCGPKEMASTLKNCGFSIISVANNHIFEYGEQLFAETVRILFDAGINVCGLRGTDEFYSKPVILNLHSKRVGFLAYNWVGKDKFKGADKYVAQVHDSIVNYTWNRDEFRAYNAENSNQNVVADIKRLKKLVDKVILLPHWGYEFVKKPPYGVSSEAKIFIDSGADLIIGSHPHVVQGFHKYDGKYIFYSLGNFLFDMRLPVTRYSAILSYYLNNDGEDRFEVLMCKSNANFIPVPIKNDELHDKLRKDIFPDLTDSINTTDNNDNLLYIEFERQYAKLKWYNILHHFTGIFYNPVIAFLILKKAMNMFRIVLGNLQGNRVRW